MNNTIRTPGLRKVMFGALALLMAHLGCTEDRHVEDQGIGGPETTTDGGGATGDDGGATNDDGSVTGDDGNGNEDGAQGSDGGGQIPGVPGGSEIPGSGDIPGNPGGGGEIPGGGEEIPMCGVSAQPLTAGQSTDIGSIVISNDASHLYVTFETEDGWLLGTTHIHVGQAADDVPMTANGKPVPGQFEYIGEGGAGTSYTVVIPLPEVECGTKLYVWAHANVYSLASDGTNALVDSAWGGVMEGDGAPSWFFVAPYDLACC